MLKVKLLALYAFLVFFTATIIYLESCRENVWKKYLHFHPSLDDQKGEGLREVRSHPVQIGSGIRVFENPLEMPDRYGFKENKAVLPEHYLKNHEPRHITDGYLLRPSFENKTSSKYFMVFLIKSTCKATERRTLVRKTWGSVKEINNQRFHIVFLIGLTKDEKTEKLLEEENFKHRDILQADVPDGYRSLPDKVLAGYQWVNQQLGNKSEFYAFTDDDCFINMALTFDYFWSNRVQFKSDPSVHCGFKYNQFEMPVRGQSKYAVSNQSYPGNIFPPFCHGGFSILSSELLSDIYRQAQITQRSDLHLEDVYITGILRTKVGQGNKNIKKMYYNNTKGHLSFYMGPFMWHVGVGSNLAQNNLKTWKIVFNLMNVRKRNQTYFGYWPSAQHLKAVVHDDCIVPEIKNESEYFANNFGTFQFVVSER